jgi:hypothetical protein
MGSYQMAILLLFNEHQQLSLNEIQEATKLNIKELEKQIMSLIENKLLLGNIVSNRINMAGYRMIFFFSYRLMIQRYQLIWISKVNEQNLKSLQ